MTSIYIDRKVYNRIQPLFDVPIEASKLLLGLWNSNEHTMSQVSQQILMLNSSSRYPVFKNKHQNKFI